MMKYNAGNIMCNTGTDCVVQMGIVSTMPSTVHFLKSFETLWETRHVSNFPMKLQEMSEISTFLFPFLYR